MTCIQLNGIRYQWTRGPFPPQVLYGAAILKDSLIPDGLVMTLRNRRDERLVIRGEMHGDRIVFVHLTGEGGTREIGAWVKTDFQLEADDPTPDWAVRLRTRLLSEFGGAS